MYKGPSATAPPLEEPPVSSGAYGGTGLSKSFSCPDGLRRSALLPAIGSASAGPALLPSISSGDEMRKYQGLRYLSGSCLSIPSDPLFFSFSWLRGRLSYHDLLSCVQVLPCNHLSTPNLDECKDDKSSLIIAKQFPVTIRCVCSSLLIFASCAVGGCEQTWDLALGTDALQSALRSMENLLCASDFAGSFTCTA